MIGMKHINRHVVNAVLLCACGGVSAKLLHIPVPWMVGPMLAMVIARISTIPVQAPTGGRELGQMIIGTAIGLFFTPSVLDEVADMATMMLLAGAGAILVGYLSALVVARLADVDRTTAFFACVPGGAAEMVLLGMRYGAVTDFVAMGQALRMMLVIIIVPPLIAFSGTAASSSYAPALVSVMAPGLAMLFLISAASALTLQKMQAPTPWMLGPLLCTVLVTASGYSWTSMPYGLSAFGQALIGCSLGSRFNREFLVRAPRLLIAIGVGTVMTILLSGMVGFLVAALIDTPLPSMILATAPGGIAEMSVTAKVLGLGVPLVTAFHVTRLVVLLTATSPIFRFMMYLNQRASR